MRGSANKKGEEGASPYPSRMRLVRSELFGPALFRLLGLDFGLRLLAPAIARGHLLFSLQRLLSLGIRIIRHIPARAFEQQPRGRENFGDLSPAQHTPLDRSVRDLLDHLKLVIAGLALIFINRHECHLLLSGMTPRGTMIA